MTRSERQKLWRQANPDKCREYEKNRKPRERKPLTDEQREHYNISRRLRPKPDGFYERNKDRRQSVRSQVNAIKLAMGCCNPACRWAGEFKPYMLEFHHIDHNEKSFNIGAIAHRSFPVIKEEASKCTVLCACCHREVTYGTLDPSSFKKCCPSG